MRKNPYVVSEETCKRFTAGFMNGLTYRVENMEVQFETTKEFLAEVLPPCYKVPEKPIGNMLIGKWHYPPGGLKGGNRFDIAIVDFDVSFQNFEHMVYPVVLYLDWEGALYEGREVWGEPKKSGTTDVFNFEDDAVARLYRNGNLLAEMEAKLGKELGPKSRKEFEGDLKASFHCQGKGLQQNPIISITQKEVEYVVRREGEGTLKMIGGKTDPLDQIPITKVNKIEYMKGYYKYSNPLPPVELEEKDIYLPYYLGTRFEHFDLD